MCTEYLGSILYCQNKNLHTLSVYIYCIWHEEHLQHTEGGDAYLEKKTFILSLLKYDGDPKGGIEL